MARPILRCRTYVAQIVAGLMLPGVLGNDLPITPLPAFPVTGALPLVGRRRASVTSGMLNEQKNDNVAVHPAFEMVGFLATSSINAIDCRSKP